MQVVAYTRNGQPEEQGQVLQMLYHYTLGYRPLNPLSPFLRSGIRPWTTST